MTPQELQTMIKAGDEQKCHVVHIGQNGPLHYFKFGSYWIVEDDGPVAVRVYDQELIVELEMLRRQLTQPTTGAPTIEHECRCNECAWEGDRKDLNFVPPDITVDGSCEFCPDCGSPDVFLTVNNVTKRLNNE